MSEQIITKIPPSLLPKNYKELAMEKFDLAESTIYAIAAGFRANNEVFDFLLELARQKKETTKSILEDRNQKINDLLK